MCAVLCPGTHHWQLLGDPKAWGKESSWAAGARRILSVVGRVALPWTQMVTSRHFGFKSCFVDDLLLWIIWKQHRKILSLLSITNMEKLSSSFQICIRLKISPKLRSVQWWKFVRVDAEESFTGLLRLRYPWRHLQMDSATFLFCFYWIDISQLFR